MKGYLRNLLFEGACLVALLCVFYVFAIVGWATIETN
jgi:hypothetical protein